MAFEYSSFPPGDFTGFIYFSDEEESLREQTLPIQIYEQETPLQVCLEKGVHIHHTHPSPQEVNNKLKTLSRHRLAIIKQQLESDISAFNAIGDKKLKLAIRSDQAILCKINNILK